MTKESGVKQKATRRGMRSLDGKFYHTYKERNAADSAFNKAVQDREATRLLLLDTRKGHTGEKSFDFTFTEKEPKQPASTIVKPDYHCDYCKSPVEYGSLVCPLCNHRLNWEGL